jgi:hypothetical protein
MKKRVNYKGLKISKKRPEARPNEPKLIKPQETHLTPKFKTNGFWYQDPLPWLFPLG